MRLGDLDALKNIFEEHEDRRGDLDCDWRILIDNAPTVIVDNCGKCPYYAEDDRNIITEAFNDGYNTAREKFKRPHGEWIYHKTNGNFSSYIECSVCHTEKMLDGISPQKYKLINKFCFNCGADMRGKEE